MCQMLHRSIEANAASQLFLQAHHLTAVGRERGPEPANGP